MPKINNEIYFIYCATCGHGMCDITEVDENKKTIHIKVCPSCMREKDEKIKELENKDK